MKRKLIRLQKKRLSILFKQKDKYSIANSPIVTFDTIAKVKEMGQRYYHQKVDRLQKLNARQLKKYRRKQKSSGLTGSKFGSICEKKLKPASAVFKKVALNDLKGTVEVVSSIFKNNAS
ncbi:hypothetical protein [Thalassotalea hakodatensis]|uniref:hypothetical protein n=1 Tax=Thalassotalea hakodatensis TaxID=3030492 RepID=UPI002573C872|nr:hypothetical protein [Thalassotalea hakodatensis]